MAKENKHCVECNSCTSKVIMYLYIHSSNAHVAPTCHAAELCITESVSRGVVRNGGGGAKLHGCYMTRPLLWTLPILLDSN